MDVHADLRQPVVLDTNSLALSPWPMLGVQRRIHERRGAELAPATSSVRYSAGSRWERHSLGFGEEILVLEGTLMDEFGDCPAVTCLRNTAGSSHGPSSKACCTIWVNTGQMPASVGPDGISAPNTNPRAADR